MFKVKIISNDNTQIIMACPYEVDKLISELSDCKCKFKSFCGDYHESFFSISEYGLDRLIIKIESIDFIIIEKCK